MANYLAQHPEIGMCRIKEPNFFNRDLDLPRCDTEEEYLALFPIGEETRLLAEASALYLCSREAPEAIHRYEPESRILIMLRNPVEAIHAWHSQMVFTCNEPIRDFPEALRAEADRRQGKRIPALGVAAPCPEILLYRGIFRYVDQVKRYIDTFGREQVQIVSYDEFRSDPLKIYGSALRSIDVDASFVPKVEIVNPNKVRRSWRLHLLIKRAFATPSRRLLSAERRLALIRILDRWNSKNVGRAPIPPELSRELRAECLPDVVRLSELLGVDFTPWCQET